MLQIQLIDQILYDADIALKQGHNDVTILTPSAIAIEVSWNSIFFLFCLSRIGLHNYIYLTEKFSPQPFQALLKMESFLTEKTMVRNWLLVCERKDAHNIWPLFV